MRNILQKIADKILFKLNNAKSLDEAKMIYNIGLMFNSFCIKHFNLYLN